MKDENAGVVDALGSVKFSPYLELPVPSEEDVAARQQGLTTKEPLPPKKLKPNGSDKAPECVWKYNEELERLVRMFEAVVGAPLGSDKCQLRG